MPSLPLLLLLSGLLLLTVVETEEDQGVEGLEGVPVVITEIERPPSLSTNSLLPLPEEKTISKEERQARRLLRKKKKRLRMLREEIRKMGGVGGGGLRAVKLARNRDEKWRRRMLSRLDAITKRLDRLETLIVESSTAAKIKNKEAEKTRKMDRHFASISRSLNGEVGMACASHRDCRPGRCCHAAGASTAGAAVAAASTCVQHDAPAAAECTDSCQCTLQLQCYASKDNATQPACKRATSTDIVTGTYLNDPSGIF
ncbi:hypothetical protein PENTCL1PPCAC_5584 [Pristionchus entomophagus]|uniref:Uncharacterized protein n=1 Tax=Pristionchus entomophagus TaxID=358040 RepID=A0AAV5ST86_9BILA|nr:hypothetical protein PENTCL1PPCAC_5584 [Pristionchus entomophagus]